MTAELDGATIEISFFRRVAASEVPTNFDKITVITDHRCLYYYYRLPYHKTKSVCTDSVIQNGFAAPTKYFIRQYY